MPKQLYIWQEVGGEFGRKSRRYWATSEEKARAQAERLRHAESCGEHSTYFCRVESRLIPGTFRKATDNEACEISRRLMEKKLNRW